MACLSPVSTWSAVGFIDAAPFLWLVYYLLVCLFIYCGPWSGPMHIPGKPKTYELHSLPKKVLFYLLFVFFLFISFSFFNYERVLGFVIFVCSTAVEMISANIF